MLRPSNSHHPFGARQQILWFFPGQAGGELCGFDLKKNTGKFVFLLRMPNGCRATDFASAHREK